MTQSRENMVRAPARITHVIVLIVAVFVSLQAHASFFYWKLEVTPPVGKKKVIKDWPGTSAFKIRTDIWDCEVQPTRGLRPSLVPTIYQEGLDIVCTLIANPEVKVIEYGACQKSGGEPEMSIFEMNVTEPKGSLLIEVSCAELSWKKL